MGLSSAYRVSNMSFTVWGFPESQNCLKIGQHSNITTLPPQKMGVCQLSCFEPTTGKPIPKSHATTIESKNSKASWAPYEKGSLLNPTAIEDHNGHIVRMACFRASILFPELLKIGTLKSRVTHCSTSLNFPHNCLKTGQLSKITCLILTRLRRRKLDHRHVFSLTANC